MSQTLDEFLEETKKEIDKFEKMWRKENKKDPEKYPISMSDGNEGGFGGNF